MTKLRRIAAHYVYTPQGLLSRGVITLSGDGTIISVDSDDKIDSRPGVEFYNGILIPGMVNAHTHLELSYLWGAIAQGGGFAAFAAGMRRTRDVFSPEQRQAAARYQDAVMWAEGVSAVGDVCNGQETFELKQRSRIYYHSFAELFGLDKQSAEAAVRLRDRAGEMGLAATVTPHATYSLNEKAFAEAVGQSGNDPLSIHFMESAAEQELFEGRGSMAAWYADCGFETDFTDRYQSPADRLTSVIEAGRRVMLVHNVCVGESEVESIGEKFGDRATWVLCPASNMYIGGKLPPVELLRRSGMRIALGTDSLASNTRLSTVDEMKLLKGVPLEDVLRWATLGGAEALGVAAVYGSFEEGKRPGVVQLTGVDMERMELGREAATRRIV